MDALRRLTIVIPTINRPKFVKRQIQFWSGLPAKVVIIDGSAAACDYQGKELPANILYVHSAIDFQSRMLASIAHIDTEFVAVLGDDDFFSPAGLRACIARLDADSSIIGCVGRSIRFTFQDGRVLAEQRDPQSTEFPPSVVSGIERLYATYHPGKIGALLYGVYRVEPWKDVVQTTYSVSYRTAYIYDTIIRVLLTYRSAIGLAETVTWYCSAENPPIKVAPGWNRLLGGVEWLTSAESISEVNDCKKRMVDDLVSLGIDQRPEIEVAVEFVINELLRRYAEKAAIKTMWTTRIRHVVVRLSPRFIRQLGKRLLPQRFRRSFDWTFVEFDRLLGVLASGEIIADVNDAQTIVDHIRETHLEVS